MRATYRDFGDVPFPTLVVGSLPRPLWVRDLVEERKAGRISPGDAGEMLDHAIPSAIRMQERAGLDYVSDGEWRRESYVKVFAEAVDGFEHDLLMAGTGGRTPVLTYPAVVRRMEQKRSLAGGEAEFLRRTTSSRTIVAIPSPYTVGCRLWSAEHSSGAYATREEFMDACIPIIREEAQLLASLGVDAIQIDEPWLALLVDPGFRERDGVTDIDREIELSVRCVNEVADAVEGVPISVHLCHAHFARKHGTSGPYDIIMGALGEMRVERFAMEFATPDAGGIVSLKDFPGDKVLGLGVIDHTDTHVETPEEVVERAQAAMRYVAADRISLNPDCGFAPSSINPMDFDEAYMKLSAMCQGAAILREKHG